MDIGHFHANGGCPATELSGIRHQGRFACSQQPAVEICSWCRRRDYTMASRPDTQPDDARDDPRLKAFAVRLREARRKAGLNQAALGELAGLHRVYIVELESGQSNVTLKTLGKIADALQMDVRDLLPGTGAAVSPAALQMSLVAQAERVRAASLSLGAEIEALDKLRQAINIR